MNAGVWFGLSVWLLKMHVCENIPWPASWPELCLLFMSQSLTINGNFHLFPWPKCIARWCCIVFYLCVVSFNFLARCPCVILAVPRLPVPIRWSRLNKRRLLCFDIDVVGLKTGLRAWLYKIFGFWGLVIVAISRAMTNYWKSQPDW